MFMELMSNSCTYGHCKNILSSVKFLHIALGRDGRLSVMRQDEVDQTLMGMLLLAATSLFFISSCLHIWSPTNPHG